MKMTHTRLSMTSLFAAALALGAFAAPAIAADGEDPGAYVKPHITHEAYGDVKIVVALTSDDKGIQAMKLRNIANALKAADEWQGRFDVKLVLYARGVTLLRDPDEAVRAKLDQLRGRGVQVVVCGNTLAEQRIDFRSLYKVSEADIVPSGFAEVAYLQSRKGYAVDPSN